MTRVTGFTVGFHRKRQPAKYEEVGALLELNVMLDGAVEDGEDWAAASADLMTKCRAQVLAAIGIALTNTERSKCRAAEQAVNPPMVGVDPAATVVEKPAKRKRRTKAEMAAARAAEVENLDDPAALINPPTEEAPIEVTSQELAREAGKAQQRAGKEAVFALMEQFGVVRLGKLTAEQRIEFVAGLEELK